MAQERPRLDDKYTDGVWYDTYNGDYAEIQRGFDDDGEPLVELVNPETADVYWDMPVAVWNEEERHDFRPVSDEAVDDPVAVVNRAIRILSRNDVGEMASIPMQEAIDLRYAREQVSIEES